MALDDETKQNIVSKFVSDVLHLRAESCTVRETWARVGKTSGSLGSLYKCQLAVSRNMEPADTHSFIAKFELAKDNPLHEFAVSNNLFNREVGFYEYASASRSELRVPSFYFSSSSPPSPGRLERYLVMEDLTSTAYTPQFEVGCSYEQCVAVITELAKVHSLDVAALPPESALNLSQDNRTLQNLYQSGIQGLLQHARGSSHLVSRQWEILIRQLPEAIKAAYEEMDGHSSAGKPHLHMTHGDVWSGNVLFSLRSTSQLIALVDWQFAGLEHCPLFDLMTFLASSVDTPIRQQYSTALLTLYLDSRSDLCKEDAEYDLLKQIFTKHFLTIGTAFAVASWEIFRVDQDNQSPGYGIGNVLLLNRFWDLLTDYCNSC